MNAGNVVRLPNTKAIAFTWANPITAPPAAAPMQAAIKWFFQWDRNSVNSWSGHLQVKSKQKQN